MGTSFVPTPPAHTNSANRHPTSRTPIRPHATHAVALRVGTNDVPTLPSLRMCLSGPQLFPYCLSHHVRQRLTLGDLAQGLVD